MHAIQTPAAARFCPEAFVRVKPGRLKEKGDVRVSACGELLPVALEEVGREVLDDEVVLRDVPPTRATY